MDKICLKGLRVYACHGVYEEEQGQKQLFTINIELTTDLEEAAKKDDIELSVDYSLIYMRVRQLVEENSFGLLETLTDRVVSLLMEDERIQAVRVEVEKSRAAYQGQYFTAAIIMERSRS